MYQDHQKVGERKKLKKVKKQWVVASTALFAFVGAAALTTTTVSADEEPAAVVSTSETKDEKTEEKSDQEQTKTEQVEGEGLSMRDGESSQQAESQDDLIKRVIADFLNGKELSVGESDQYKAYWSILEDYKKEHESKLKGAGTSDVDYTKANITDKNNVTQSKEQADAYEKALKDKLNNKDNKSVHTATDGQAVQTKDLNKTNDNKGNQDFFNKYVVQQGAADAESGRFNGYNTKDNPVINISDDESDAYSQAFKGAQAAMAAQWKDDKNLKDSLDVITEGSDAYRAGYNDVVAKFNSGIVFVANGQQFHTAFTGNNHNMTDGGAIPSGRNTINLIDDIDFKGVPYSEQSPNVNGLEQFVINGQHHIMDAHGTSYKIYPGASGTSAKLTIKNFQELAGWNYYGPFVLKTQATMHYSNINYVGPQLISALDANVEFSGKVNIINVPQYTTHFTTAVSTQGGDRQENMEIQNLTLEPNTDYFASTVQDGTGGTAIYMRGTLLMGENSSITTIPRGNSGQHSISSTDWGIYIDGSKGNLKLQKGATITIIPEKSDKSSKSANGIYSSGTIDINGGEINILADGPSGNSNQQFNSTGTITIRNNGRFNVIAKNLKGESATSGIVRNGKTFNVLDQGTVNVSADGTGNVILYSGSIAIVNPGQDGVVFDLTQNTNNNSKLASGDVKGSSIKVADKNDGKYSDFAYSVKWNNGTWVLVDKNKNTDRKSGVKKFLKIASAATAKFTSPLSVNEDENHKKHATGYFIIQNFDKSKGTKVNLQVATGTVDNYDDLTQVKGNLRSDNASDENLYNQQIEIPEDYHGEALKYDIELPDSYNKDEQNVGVRAVYSVSNTNIVRNPKDKKNTVSVQGIDADGKKINLKGDSFAINNIDTSHVEKAVDDAKKDIAGKTDKNKDKDLYVSDENYKSAYDSYKDGYKAAKSDATPKENPGIPAGTANAQSFSDGYTDTAGEAANAKKPAAKAAIDKALQETLDAINGDNALPENEKEAQRKAAKAKAEEAKKNIDKAKTVAGVDAAEKNGEADVRAAHVPYSLDLDGQKKAAKDAIKKALDATNKLIDDDPTLDGPAKKKQKKAAKDAADAANKAIDDAKDSDAVTAAQKDNVPKIFDAHQTDKNGIPAHQSAAKAALKEALKNTKAAIDADPTLNDKEKQAQKDAAEKAEKEAEDNVDAKDNVTDILNAQTAGVKDIDSKHVVNNTPVPAQKSAAKAAIDEALKNTEAAIESDPTLTPDQKSSQKAKAEQDATNAKNDIDHIDDKDSEAAQKIVEKQNSGAAQIHNDHQSEDMGQQKSAAKAAAKKALEETIKAIDADPTLTDDEKDDQKSKATDQEENVEKAIDNAKNATEIIDVQNGDDGVPSIYKKHKQGETPSFAARKAAAKAAIDEALKETKARIENDKSLPGNDSAAQNADAEARAQAAKNAIDEANKDNLETVQKNGVDDVHNAYKSGVSLDQQKAAAKSAIDDIEKKTEDAIKADPTLTDDQKSEQINKAKATAQTAKDNIGNADSADEVVKRQQDGVDHVVAEHKEVNDSVAGQQIAAKPAIEDARQKTVDAIQSDPNLTTDQKNAQIDAANREAGSAVAEIDGIKNDQSDAAQKIKDAQSKWVPDIYRQHVTSDLDAQKQAARAAVEDARAKSKAAIDADPTLDTTAKDNQKKAVDDAAGTALDNIDHHSDSADELAGHQKEDIPAIHIKHEVNKDDVPAQQLAAHAAVKDALDKTKAAIQADPTLNSDEKKEQIEKAETAAAKADRDIDNAHTAQAIEDAEKQDLPEIFDAHKHAVDPLPAQRVAGNGSIDEALDKMKAEIDADSTLDDDEKAEQKHDAEEAARRAKDNVEAATDADGIIMAQKIGVAAISHVHRAHVEKPKPAQPVAPAAPASPKAEVKHAQPETAKEAASQALSSIWMLAVAATGFVLSKAKKDAK